MAEELNLVRDLAIILVSAGLFTIISKALKQPLGTHAHQYAPGGEDQYNIPSDDSLRFGLGKDRKIGCVPGPESIAKRGKRTQMAIRRSGNADCCAQIHYSLIMITGPFNGYQSGSKRFNMMTCFVFKGI